MKTLQTPNLSLNFVSKSFVDSTESLPHDRLWLMEADAVVERWTSPDELVWYMRFASGWIIQGGFVYTNNESTNVTLPVPFSSSNYTAVAINYINGSAANYNPAISFMSETELTWSAAIGSKAMSFGYIAMGMGAQ